jgi:hypothetical protein
MTEYEATQRAKANANSTGEAWYVVTHRDFPGQDYDVMQAGSLARANEVVQVLLPDPPVTIVETGWSS